MLVALYSTRIIVALACSKPSIEYDDKKKEKSENEKHKEETNPLATIFFMLSLVFSFSFVLFKFCSNKNKVVYQQTFVISRPT